jgi:predicted HicB family RNase H-like nuclease
MEPVYGEKRGEKLTVRLSESLRRGLEIKAASEFTTLATLVNRAVFEYLSAEMQKSPGSRDRPGL